MHSGAPEGVPIAGWQELSLVTAVARVRPTPRLRAAIGVG